MCIRDSYYDVETTVSPVTTDNDAVISITNEVFVITKYLYPAEEGKFGSTARALSHNEATADPAVSTRGVSPNVSPETLVTYSVLKKAVLLLSVNTKKTVVPLAESAKQNGQLYCLIGGRDFDNQSNEVAKQQLFR